MRKGTKGDKGGGTIELTDAVMAGLVDIAHNTGEAIEVRLFEILKAAIKAGGGGSENRAGVEAMTRAQVTELMNDAANMVITAVEDNFSCINPVEDWGSTCKL